MWALQNRTPYAAERTWIRDKRGAHHWVVAVKATFAVADDGALRLADEQKPPLLAPEYFGKPGESSVRYEADLGPMRPTTDITLLGSAHAPGGRPAGRVETSLRVDDVHKALIVYGERAFLSGIGGGLDVSSPVAFTKRPIVYELAFGGTDTTDPDPRKHALDKRNPIGRGFAVKPSALADRPAPCIERPGTDVAQAGPAGYGPIASYWSPRLELWGTYDAHWAKTKKPLLPDDYDERVALCAPADQRPPRHLYGGEPVELVNLTPGGRLRFALPKIYFTFQTAFGSRREEHRSRLVSVVIEPDESRLMLTWLTTLAVVASQIDYLDHTVIDEKPYLT
jgi:hypothetical protein